MNNQIKARINAALSRGLTNRRSHVEVRTEDLAEVMKVAKQAPICQSDMNPQERLDFCRTTKTERLLGELRPEHRPAPYGQRFPVEELAPDIYAVVAAKILGTPVTVVVQDSSEGQVGSYVIPSTTKAHVCEGCGKRYHPALHSLAGPLCFDCRQAASL